MKDKEKNRKLIVIDGNSLINRAYYAIQRPMITKDGLYTQAVYGFLNILQKIRNDYDPGYMVVAFDMKGPTFRHEEYAEYKAGRKRMPAELAMQIPVLKEALDLMKIGILEIEGFEADDIIGTVVKKAEEENYHPLIITGDKDALQLASKTTKVIITRKGISEFDSYDHDTMVEKYGFTPDQFIDFKGLMGDASDNIPGIPGVGEKTAQKLVWEYGSVANLIASLDKMANSKLKQRIEDNAQLALMSRRLAEINTQVPLEIDLEKFIEEEPDYEKLIELYKRLEFNSFLKKLRIPDSFDEDTFPEINPVLKLIKGGEDLPDLEKGIAGAEELIIKTFSDGNHKNKPILTGLAISTEKHCFYIDCSDKDVLKGVKSLIGATKARFAGHTLQNDYYTLLTKGFSLSKAETAFDTEIAQYLLQPGRRNFDFSTLILEYFHQDLEAPQEIINQQTQLDFLSEEQGSSTYKEISEYVLRWSKALFKLRSQQERRLKQEGLLAVFQDVELPLVLVLASMEVQGISVDKDELMNSGKKLRELIDKETDAIIKMAGRDFNINSPKQLGEILFEDLGLPTGKKTKTGYSTNVEVLEGLKGKHEIIDHILEYRTLTKLNGTYVEGLLPLLHEDGKIHAHFQQTVAATGRISCTEPNLQNIPIRQEMGRKIRKAFVAEGNQWIFVGADYSQIELRVLAHLSEDPSLIEAFRKGTDIHRSTASRVFAVPESQVTPLQRNDAKAVNFGVIYGMSSFGLSVELNITRKMAENYIKEYFTKHSKVKEYMDWQIEECRRNGYVTTIMNRKRPIPEINSGNYMQRQAGERLAMNSPIQGSAADIIKIAMIRCHDQLIKEGLRSRLILQIHDELIIQAHKDELDQVKKILKENMENAVSLKVPLFVELNTGENWYHLK